MEIFKHIAARLPNRWQTELKRIHFGRQIKRKEFVSPEPEFKILSDFVSPGDWVIDIGANVGHYTNRLSELVGKTGRVIAFEPVPETFSLLSANVQLFQYANVTLINAAVSDKLDIVSMTMPNFPTGLQNYYRAEISTSSLDKALSVLSISLDSLCLTQHIGLIKIDAEGHESFVLSGMHALLECHHPVLIVETESKEVVAKLSTFGYTFERLQNSPNIIFRK